MPSNVDKNIPIKAKKSNPSASQMLPGKVQLLGPKANLGISLALI